MGTTGKSNLSDVDLKKLIKKLREEGATKLEIVKAVWDVSTKGLKEAKEFVDNN